MASGRKARTPAPQPGPEFPEYLSARLAERGLTVLQFCEASGLSPSAVFRWKREFRPDIPNSRLIAKGLGVPLLEVLMKAGRITADEARAEVHDAPELSAVASSVLVAELNRRIQLGGAELDRAASTKANDE